MQDLPSSCEKREIIINKYIFICDKVLRDKLQKILHVSDLFREILFMLEI